MPKAHAKMPNNTTVKKQEKHAILDKFSFSWFTSESTSSATLVVINEKIKAPRKLKTADKSVPCHSFNVPDETTEKTEFGASVQPFTKTTRIERKSERLLKIVTLSVISPLWLAKKPF